MMNVVRTIAWLAFTAAAVYALSEWAVRQSVQPVAPVVAVPEKAVVFEEAYPRYIEKVSGSRYAGRVPLEVERVERHLAILQAELDKQRALLAEAQRGANE